MDIERQASRREFLCGRAVRGPRSGPIERLSSETAEDSYSGSRTLLIGRSAMASRFEVCFDAADLAAVDSAWEILDLVDHYEARWSYFRPDSEISLINASAAEAPFPTADDLFALLQRCLTYARETQGAFDLTATPLWEIWGFARREGRVPEDDEIHGALEYVGMHYLELDPAHRTVRFLKHGVRINLGAVGKGCVLDVCTERLESAGVRNFLLSGGLSSMTARGRAPEGREDGWTVGIRHPLRPDRRIGRLILRNRAVATSGSYLQSFRVGNRRFGHIIDPRVGRPVEHMLSTTVSAPTAEVADALSTAFYVMGPERAAEYCRTRPELGAVLITPSRTSGGWTMQLLGTAAAEFIPES